MAAPAEHKRLYKQLCPLLKEIAAQEAARGNYLIVATDSEAVDGHVWRRFVLRFRFHENYPWRGLGLRKHINRDIHDWSIEYACKEFLQTLMCQRPRLKDAQSLGEI